MAYNDIETLLAIESLRGINLFIGFV
jgi:hypothetical protein